MTDLQADVLRVLRLFGPCSNAEISRRLRLPPHTTYRQLCLLCSLGLARHPKLQVWEISERGRKVFGDMPGRPLALFAVPEGSP